MTAGSRAVRLPRTRVGRLVAVRGLSVVLFALYALAQLGAAVIGWIEFLDQQRQHGQPADLFGQDGYIWTLLEQTTQNWQSEFLALATLIALSAHLIHRRSKHSRDGNDEVQQRVRAIDRRVSALGAARRTA